MQIGKYTLTGKVLLAPMAGTSDKPFRMICKEQGAALTTSEMVVIQKHLLNSTKSKYRLDFTGENEPISIQIAGADVEHLLESALKALVIGADIIDINMGCPTKKVCNKHSGSALMKNEKLVAEILTKVVKAVDIPVTLKIRTGWSNDNKNAPVIAKIAQDCGIKMLAIHGRTREEKYFGTAEYDTIAKVVDSIDIPVVANGDIDSAKKAKKVLQYTGAQAVMLGRATQGNPWLIGEVDYYLSTGKEKTPVSNSEKIPLILRHISNIYNFYGKKLGVNLSRKHIFWYSIQISENKAQDFWKKINKVTDQSEQYSIFKNYLYSL